jgi:hypothetical protein
MQRPRFTQEIPFDERLAQEAERLRKQAEALPHGPEREKLLRKARQAETAAHVDQWLSSPGLQPPKSIASCLLPKLPPSSSPEPVPTTIVKLSMVSLDCKNEEAAVELAKRLAEQTGCIVTVRDADGELVGTFEGRTTKN